jgi:hypothetical protein
MGDELPPVTPKPKPLKVVSAFRQETETELTADHIPVGLIIKSAVLLASATVSRREAVLLQHKSLLPVEASD